MVRKMRTELAETVQYHLLFGDTEVSANALLGQAISLEYTGVINCVHCNRKTNKSFSQGYCYPCFKRLAQCDTCIVKPELCHHHLGTCREPEWGEQNCMIDHIVYLSNTSGVKVGITRGSQVPTRWMDQGATQAQPIFRVSNRLQSGEVETTFAKHIADKTNWQAMLKGNNGDRDLEAERQRLMSECAAEIELLRERNGLQAITVLENEAVTQIRYPVLEFPTKVKSFNLDKTPEISGTLMGIKGQYLIFDTGVINMRKYGGYHVALNTL
ncbi:DUF2797 domain-containing protein [Marinobacter alexandrii]|uniref:DUF2797 domain-containing protein n=1 Tax=Marinobacter alexandrii TaxID=2570351 RepID=UPI003297A1F5